MALQQSAKDGNFVRRTSRIALQQSAKDRNSARRTSRIALLQPAKDREYGRRTSRISLQRLVRRVSFRSFASSAPDHVLLLAHTIP